MKQIVFSKKVGANCISFLLCLAVLFSGCTGIKTTVEPSPDSFPQQVPQKFEAVSVKEMTANQIYPPTGWMTQDFAREIEASGLSKTVYFPSRPDDKVDAVLESKFDVSMDPHMGMGLIKAFLTGFTFFLLEPLFWYHYDYNFNGFVEVVQGNQRIAVEETTNSSLSVKWLSLFQAQKAESELLMKSKKSLFLQLIDKISKY